jgi:SSS family solute:Na+ symporter
MILAALWSTLGDRFSSIFDAVARVAMALSPSVATVLLLGVLYRRGTKEASLVTLIVGLILGVTAFLLDFPPVSGGLIMTNNLGIPFMMQAFWLFIICIIIFVVISLLTPKPDPGVIEKYTWENPLSTIKGRLKGWNDVRIVILLLILILFILYLIFS